MWFASRYVHSLSTLPASPVPPLFSLFQPKAASIEAALPRLDGAPLSYTEVGGTESGERPDWWYHREDVALGTGEATFRAAVDALERWVPFDLPWVHLHDPALAIEPGRLVAFSSRQFGIWALNVCRIVYVVDERTEAGVHRFGFGYGTLASHAVQGEERFLITWDPADDTVRFEVAKFSRARHFLVRAAGPLTWWIQTRFTRDALERMRKEVS